MIYKRYSLFCFLLLVATILPMVNERGFSLMPSVMAQSMDTKELEAERFLKLCRENLGNDQAEAAIKFCQQAVTAHQQVKDLSGEAKSAVNLGIAYVHLKQYSKAIPVLESALKKIQASKERRVEAIAFFNLGIAYYGASEKPQPSIDFFQKALAIAQEIKDIELEKDIREILSELQKLSILIDQRDTEVKKLLTSSQLIEANKLLQQGVQQIEFNQFQEALSSFKKALGLYQEIKNQEGQAKSLGNLGIVSRVLGQSQQAIEYYQQSLNLAQQIGDRLSEAQTYGNLGNTYYSLGEYKKAIEYNQKSLGIAKEVGDRSQEAYALGNLGDVYASQGEYQKAIQYNEKSLAIAEQIKDITLTIKTLGNLGVAYESLEQYQEAIKKYEESLKIARQINNASGEANALGNLGNVYSSMGEYQKAIEYHKQSLAIAEQIGDPQVESYSLGNLGLVYYSLGEYQKAIKYHEQSLAITKQIGDRAGEAKALGNLGIAYHSRGEYQKAINYYQQYLDISQKIGDLSGEAISLGNLGSTYDSLGEYQQAIEYYQKSLAIAQKIGDRSVEANASGNLGNIYQSLGQYKNAIDYHQKSLAIAQKIGDRSGEAKVLGNLGNSYASLKMDLEAINYHQKSYDIAKKIGDRYSEAYSLGNLGVAYHSLGQDQKAINYYQQSLTISTEIGDVAGQSKALGNLGNAYNALGQYQKVTENYQQSLAIAQKIGDRSGEAKTLNNLGIAYQYNNQPLKAIENLEQSLNITLTMRGKLVRDNRKLFLANNQKTAISLAEVLIQQNQPEKAFEWLNLATTADLADYNRLIDGKVANPKIQTVIDNWKAKNKQLEDMRRQLQTKFTEELAKEIREFEAKVYTEAETIAQKYPEVAELFETKPTDIAQLRQNITPDTLVIQPVSLRDKIALFLLTKDKLTVIESNTKVDEFNQLVNQYRNQLADHLNSDYLVTSSQLYDILIRPIEQQIKTNSPKNLAIIATDQLRYIPFESLYDSKTEQYLLQKYPISYLTRISTANIPNSPSKTAKNLKALAFANPKPTNKELKGTEKEAENLLKIFPQSETYLGEKATLDTFKTQASRFSILHLGTHGCFNPNGCPDLKMQANTILFANNQQYNIADAALLGLKNTELITLSACQTAKEANANGQEISGLAYVLERAGAKSVIASLWNAEDNTSAEIMTQFYQNLQKGMTKSEAMQKAKLNQIEKNKDLHPFFWSPFILIGDAQ